MESKEYDKIYTRNYLCVFFYQPLPTVIKLAQADLEKQNYDGLNKLQEMLEYHDNDK